MTWVCPKCRRSFRNAHQSHSCAVTPIKEHLQNKNPNIIELFNQLSAYIESLGTDVRRISLKNAVLFATKNNFIALKPKREWLDVEFNLDRKMDIFPIHKTMKVTKVKYCHFLRIDSVSDINGDLHNWLKEAYLVSQKN